MQMRAGRNAHAKSATADPSGNELHLNEPTLSGVVPQEGNGPATANAAVALAQLHNWDSDYVSYGLSGDSEWSNASYSF